jgi:hypothetical protein
MEVVMAIENSLSILEREFQYYRDHQDEFVAQYDGRIIVLKDNKVLGDYATEFEALTETRKEHEIGTFLIQRVSQGDEAYTMTFHSRAVFP